MKTIPAFSPLVSRLALCGGKFSFATLWSQCLALALTLGALPLGNAAERPAVGQKAPDFTLKALGGENVRLSTLTSKSRVVLVMLRGFPGYQCPACDRQVQDFIASAPAFAAAKARVVFVYPGPAAELEARAQEFKTWKGKQWPAEFVYVLDPDYTMVNAYGLRWDAPRETAYPATFILDDQRVVRFSNISSTHGGRTKAADILAELK